VPIVRLGDAALDVEFTDVDKDAEACKKRWKQNKAQYNR